MFVSLLSASRADGSLYQLVGKIRQEDGKVFHGVVPVVSLFSNTTLFSMQALADLSGGFRIKDVPPGPYTINISVPHVGDLIQSVEIGPSFADTKRRIVKEFLFRRKPPGKVSHVVSATQLSVPDKARGEYLKAQECLKRRNMKCANEHLLKAVKIAPQFSGAWNTLGTIAFQCKKLEEAEGYFREAFSQDPGHLLSLVNLGGTILLEGRLEEALPLNQAAVQSDPDDPLAQSQLGQNYFRLGQYDLAERHLRLARSLDQSHFTYPQLVLADIYQRRRDFSSLVRELEEFLRLHPDSSKAPDVRRLLGYARSRALATSN
ncbi:MAG TPA: tetratricopeptide repeat protein [Acidobacteriota bacterium]|nr:tetratricopeptide repeat protein [Acidobacteriota bacterium]